MIPEVSKKRRLPDLIVKLAGALIVAFTIFLAIWRILLWDIINPLITANTLRLMLLLGIDDVEVAIKWTPIARFFSYFVVISVVIILGARHDLVRSKRFWLMCIPLLAVLAISIFSQFWSLNSSNTAKRSLFLLATTLGGIFIGLEYKRSRIIWIFEILAIGYVLLSYAMILVYPVQATIFEVGDWRGFFNYKSFSSVMFAVACILFLFRLANFKKEGWFIRVYSVTFLLLSIYFLLNTNGATAMVALMVSLFLFILGLLFIKFGRRIKPGQWIWIGALAIFLLLGFWLARDALFGIFGRNASLTGRIPMWLTLVPFIKQRLVFGYGFGEVFWYSDYLEEFLKVAPWQAKLAHSGYVEALLDTGLVGILFWVAFLLEVTYLSVRYFILERTLYSMFFIICTVFVLLINVTENLLGTYEIFNVLLLVVSFAFLTRGYLSVNQSTE